MKRKVWLVPVLGAIAVATVASAAWLPCRSVGAFSASGRPRGEAWLVAHAVTSGVKALVWLARP